MSECGMIGYDLIAEFQQATHINGFEIDEFNWYAQPFSGAFDEHTAGFMFTIDFHYTAPLNKCLIPKS